MIKLDMSQTTSFSSHRSGWGYCISKLRPAHSKNGILLEDFIDATFGWDYYKIYCRDINLPYTRKWVGFLHNPPNFPDWFDAGNSPQAILSRDKFQESLKNCCAIVCLSEYLSSWLRNKIDNQVITVKHPTEIPLQKWSMSNFLKQKQKKLVQLGYWLRKLDSIHNIKCDSTYKKVWLPSSKRAIDIFNLSRKIKKNYQELDYQRSGVDIIFGLSNKDFDSLLSGCLILLDLYDSSANNAIVESIARNAPILVNRIPATEEYLGKDYPLYFEDLSHASAMMYDFDKIFEAHTYLKNMDKKWISGTYFATDLMRKLEDVV